MQFRNRNLGMTAFAVALVILFAACSDYEEMYQNAYGSLMEEEEDLSSNSVVKSSSSSAKKVSSSSAKASSSSNKTSKSSSSVKKSSSSVAKSSSSKKSSSSNSASSQTDPITDFGTCGPARATVTKGDTISWVLRPKDPTLLFKASVAWSMPGGLPSTGSAKNVNGRTQMTQYASTGDFGATVQVVVDDASYNITCDPLHVNGYPITGCECTTEAPSVDLLENPAVTWTVSGCKTGTGTHIVSYEWDGHPGDATYAKIFDAATSRYIPTLRVTNDDNTVLDVTCPAVKVTEGPEYELKSAQEGVVFTNVGHYTVVGNLPSGWHNNDLTCSISCKSDSYEPFELTFDGIEVSGYNYVSITKMQVAHTVNGYKIPVEVTALKSGNSITCGVNW